MSRPTRIDLSALRSTLPLALGLGIATAGAIAAPFIGAAGGPIRSQMLTPVAVGVIFFIQGLQLPAREALRGLTAWPLHAFCMGWMFIAYPLIAVAILFVAGDSLLPAFRTGILFTALLPTTIATNAAYSSKAGGNPAVVLFNIVAGNALGIFLAPLALAWLLAGAAEEPAVDLSPLAKALALQIVLPFLAGQVLRPFVRAAIEKGRTALREGSSLMVYFIVYTSLCNFFITMEVRRLPEGFGMMLMLTLLLLFTGSALCWFALGRMPYPQSFRIAAFYAASQKTLAAGLPIANAVYSSMPGTALPPLALLILPLILFHFFQLVLGAALIPFFAGAQTKKM